MRQLTLNYLRRRYLELEKEIANAALHDHDLVVADRQYRKLVIADEIEGACAGEDVGLGLLGPLRQSENMPDERNMLDER